MRMLFAMDRHDYDDCTHTFVRDSARSIIIRDGRVAMIHSLKKDYYKFPGGGIEHGEDAADAAIRETREETGLIVIPETIREYGVVHRIQKSDSDPEEIFVQDNYYFICDVLETLVPQELEEYESEEGFALEFVDPREAIRKNRELSKGPYHSMRLEREAKVLEMLISEGFLR